MKGAIAVCSMGSIGLILSERPVPVTYADGSSAEAWVGIHLTDHLAPFGSPWSSRQPRIICGPEEFRENMSSLAPAA